MIKIRFIAVLLAVIVTSNLFSQNRDSIIFYTDYLSLNYKYIDENHKIKIDSDTFENAIKKYKFYRERIINYNDSLGVVLMLEFDDWDFTTAARYQISYSWKRLGYHTWQTEKEAKDFAICFGITHPWRMKEFLIDETNNGKAITDFFEDLKQKVKDSDNAVSFEGLSRNEILNVAMQRNPIRIKRYQEELYKARHGKVDDKYIGVGCGKENCCQKKGEE